MEIAPKRLSNPRTTVWKESFVSNLEEYWKVEQPITRLLQLTKPMVLTASAKVNQGSSRNTWDGFERALEDGATDSRSMG